MLMLYPLPATAPLRRAVLSKTKKYTMLRDNLEMQCETIGCDSLVHVAWGVSLEHLEASYYNLT
jgi:hypothetical protein